MPRRQRYCYDWPRPGVTVDLALFTVAGAPNELRLPGGLVERGGGAVRGPVGAAGGRLREAPILFELLPAAFTLSELQALAEAILGRGLDRRNFRRKVLEAGVVEPTGGSRREGAHRPAALYRFVPEAFERHAERERWL